jgi:CHAT domain-containing protein
MMPVQRIRIARELTDEWVAIRPPPAHQVRSVTLPQRKDEIAGSPLARLLDSLHVPWREQRFPPFRVRSWQDAIDLDARLFDPRRQDLLDKADGILEPLFTAAVTSDVEYGANLARSYCRTQQLLWLQYLGVRIDTRGSWADIRRMAEAALQAGRSEQEFLEEQWIEGNICASLSMGLADLYTGNSESAINELLFVLGWYTSATQLGYSELTRRRERDWLDAIYSILDLSANSPADSIWSFTCTVLLKAQDVGHYRLTPPFFLERARDKRTLDRPSYRLNLNFPFLGSAWLQALDALGGDRVILDLVITERTLQVRINNGPRTWKRVINLASVEEHYRRWFSAEGSIFDPVTSTQLRLRPGLASEWLAAEKQPSQKVTWLSHYQEAEYLWDSEHRHWTWRRTWTTMLPTGTVEIWRSIHKLILAEVIDHCQAHHVNHLIISPDGSLGAIPFHLVADEHGNLLGDAFSVSYLPNVASILTVVDRPQLGSVPVRAVIVRDPSRTVGLADWECDKVARSVGVNMEIIEPSRATAENIVKACNGADVFHFTGHALFDWQEPANACLSVADGKRMHLADLGAIRLRPGALVFLSACHTARRGASGHRWQCKGLVTKMFDVGASTVICTLWPVESVAAALVAHWFYEACFEKGMGRLESLNLATRRLRKSTHAECEQITGRRLYLRDKHPFADHSHWGAFILHGAW